MGSLEHNRNHLGGYKNPLASQTMVLFYYKKNNSGISWAVQKLRLRTCNAGVMGSTHGWESKIPSAARCS